MTMKILVLGSRIPWPLHDGGAIATYQLLKGLAQKGAEITFFSYNTSKHFQDAQILETHFSFCRVISFHINANPNPLGALWSLLKGENYNIERFFSKKASVALAKLLREESFDIIHVEGLYATPLLFGVNTGDIPAVLRQHNVEFKIWEKLAQSQSQYFKRWYLDTLAKGLKKYEMQQLQSYRHILSISLEDDRFFRSEIPQAEVYYFPAGMDIEPLEAPVTIAPQRFCHIGSMEWMPNVEGVGWFLENVWPAILEQVPGATFHIAGKGLDPTDKRFLASGLVNHGEVSNSRAFMRENGIVVVPLMAGSGIRMKTLEAMSLGLPVISTTVGAAGLNVVPNEHIRIADTAKQWMEAAVELLVNAPQCAEMGAKARLFVQKYFGNDVLIAKLLQHYQSILSHEQQ